MEQVTGNVYTDTTLRGCNPSYVVTDDGVVVVDTPQLPTRAVAMRQEASSHGPVRYLVNTEHHVDPVPPPAPAPPTSLAPGFRFHPTDEELVIYYLKRKVSGKSFRFDAISEVDIYRSEPWDLAGHSLCFHFISLYFHLSVLKFEIFVVLFLWDFFFNVDAEKGRGYLLRVAATGST